MARRRKTRVVYRYRTKRARRRRTSMFGGITGLLKKVALGVGGGMVASWLLTRMFRINIDPNLVQLGGAYYFGGLAGVVGQALVTGSVPFMGAGQQGQTSQYYD